KTNTEESSMNNFNLKETEDMLNSKNRSDRLEAVRILRSKINDGTIPAVPRKDECNNHVHSKYSFSPYSPSMIAWRAYLAGLDTCGIMDHESVAGCLEFREACEILGIIPTIGFEIRLSMDNTEIKGKMLNNPEQPGIGYFPVHGIPLRSLDKVSEFLKPIRHARELRNRRMTSVINEIISPYGMELDFDRDIIPLSNWNENGSITERHILFATAKAMLKECKRGNQIIDFLKIDMDIPLQEKAQAYLSDTESPIYEYDLLNVLKGFFSEKMYIPTTLDETPDIRTAIPYLNSIGCIPTYTYLGDIRGVSVTGDKKSMKFEDDILDELFVCFNNCDMRAMSYAPTRNKPDQIVRLRSLCKKYDMFEVSGEDINQPRQGFICSQRSEEDRVFFNDSTWALIGHETKAEKDLEDSIISDRIKARYPERADRIRAYKEIALGH
ncbi:MAG: PHP domain-containing protein, partial [Lachnospiraceae bacterium]